MWAASHTWSFKEQLDLGTSRKYYGSSGAGAIGAAGVIGEEPPAGWELSLSLDDRWNLYQAAGRRKGLPPSISWMRAGMTTKGEEHTG